MHQAHISRVSCRDRQLNNISSKRTRPSRKNSNSLMSQCEPFTLPEDAMSTVHAITPEQATMIAGFHTKQMSIEASTLGLKPYEWPEVIDLEGISYVRCQVNRSYGQLISIDYYNNRTILTVFN